MAEEGSIRGAWPGLAEEEWGRIFSYGKSRALLSERPALVTDRSTCVMQRRRRLSTAWG